ncbi:diacylglycerol O-acyltransferase [Colletotrichum graminicola]|uniref:Diacylglycerol O-acyltransferase n=1 Tax=Colletotrichum graminicola (strain M1.001 / M2 / FGSC 10212) TaxID=645133 RepID=E3R0Q8_COLGM|nr:diacylglycerol O-acyltransferase [Colletotrichum graminicola M1.001]EFQ36696.1 diacylglycerol O-acyltransferase [Colletotrichum graminicola M1.001]WDK14854.1 diacylglycerol O-acyltransferase [Colletotrichum graminicola]
MAVLFLCNSELGQAQIVLGVAANLIKEEKLQVHIASFPALRSRISQINGIFGRSNPIRFHALSGPSMTQGYFENFDEVSDMCHPCGIQGAAHSYTLFPKIVATYNNDQYRLVIEACRNCILETCPALIVVDAQFWAGLDVCRNGSTPYFVITPSGLWGVIAGIQPHGAIMWKYPVIGSGFPFPIPLSLIPANIYLTIRLLLALYFSSTLSALLLTRRSLHLEGQFPMFETYRKDEHYILPGQPATDFHYEHIPDNLTCCGPLTIPYPQLQEQDPQLDSWLLQRRTVLVNLGSHIKLSVQNAIHLAKALQVTLERHSDAQVLWKLNCTAEGLSEARSTLQNEINQDRARISAWLEVDPTAIMKSGQLGCVVHHAGANTFYEALGCSGAPQIALPMWLDTYNIATHMEYLDVGIWANKNAAPNIDRDELSRCLLTVMGDSKRSLVLRSRAREMQEACAAGGGSERAATKILNFLRLASKF